VIFCAQLLCNAKQMENGPLELLLRYRALGHTSLLRWMLTVPSFDVFAPP
jgi:hypothetical protein